MQRLLATAFHIVLGDKQNIIEFCFLARYFNTLTLDEGYRPETSVIFLLCGTGIVLVLFYIYPIVPHAPAFYRVFVNLTLSLPKRENRKRIGQNIESFENTYSLLSVFLALLSSVVLAHSSPVKNARYHRWYVIYRTKCNLQHKTRSNKFYLAKILDLLTFFR